MKKFKYIEKFNEYVKRFKGSLEEMMSYEELKENKRVSVFTETEDFLRYSYYLEGVLGGVVIVSATCVIDDLDVKSIYLSDEEFGEIAKRARVA